MKLEIPRFSSASFALLLCAALLGSCDSREAQAPAPPAPEVAFVVVQAQRVTLTSELPGRAAACLIAEIRPQVNGLILKRQFEEGSDIKEGQILYQLDDALFQAALKQAEANLTATRKTAQQARLALEASLAAAEQQQAVLDLARTNRERIEKLAADGAAPESDRDRYVAEAEVAEAAMRSAQAQVNSSRQAVELAEAGIAQAEAAVESARINLGYTKITAPISGRIGKSSVTVGSLVTAHQPLALATIQQLDPIYVDVPQSYGELLQLRRRLENNHIIESNGGAMNEVRLILETGESYAHPGTLEFRDVTVNPSTSSVLVRMVFPNPEAILLPGMFVRSIITEGVNPAGILAPQQAISRDTKGRPIAMVLDATDTIEQREVTLDRAIGSQWLVSSGLAPGDRLIVEGLQRARHGVKAKAVPFHETTPATPPAESEKSGPSTSDTQE